MRRTLQLVALAVLLGGTAAAIDKSLEQLQAELAKASESKKPEILLEIARLQLEEANRLFTEGYPDRGHAQVAEAVRSVEEAVKAARASGKRMKKTEIRVRKLAGRMEDIAKTLALDDRPPAEKAARRLMELSDELLHDLFDLEHPKKEKS